MCSIGEDDFGDEGGVHAMIPDIKPTKGDIIKEQVLQLCNKCKNTGAVYKLPFREAECKECFLQYARHKFRAALGSSKVLPKDANVILVFDGSAESVVLLDILHHAQTQNAFKRLHCNATVLHIDNYELLHGSTKTKEDYHEFLGNMQTFLSNYEHFKSYIIPMIGDQQAVNFIFNMATLKEHYLLRDLNAEHLFLNSINSIKSLTSRQDFVKHHCSKLIAITAKHFQCSFAFVSDISSDLASDLLAAVALGRGCSAALDVALVDDRLGDDIKLIRPLKDLNITEVEFYLKAQDLKPQQPKSFGLDKGSTASLQNLTKSFVDNLQQNFSSTVSTVFRTGDKITANNDLAASFKKIQIGDGEKFKPSELYCTFCKSLLDYQDSTTLLAIEFSRLVSESGATLDKCPNLDLNAKQNVEGSKDKCYLKKLCHGCRNICMESPDKNLLL